eukprot:CAMPEP_0201577214 /NCGR_PEP_ID=MMETSP0190_2-20130828/23484_1 /ASSEMBLY_ACC=CAM_ASM_000263 /TAXON_ID=37353 /ORGANISM="Rosalina sp." /LENGTH=226 /DNA_ID=CAMNT_0048009001 /DNA_START=180 /DNA_END=857 /DNA_ORIENTATION=+
MPKKGNKKGGNRRSPNKNSPNRRSPNKKKGNQHHNQHKQTSPNNGSKSTSNGSSHNNNNNNPSSSNTSTQQNGTNNDNLPKSPAMILKDKGNTEFQNHNYKKAIDFYSKAIDLEPDNHTLYSNRSAAYKSFGKFDEALDDANKCIELQADWAKGYVRKGTVYIQQNKLQLAEEVFKQGMKLCLQKEPLKKAMNLLENEKIARMGKEKKTVGGDHAQAEKFRTLINW